MNKLSYQPPALAAYGSIGAITGTFDLCLGDGDGDKGIGLPNDGSWRHVWGPIHLPECGETSSDPTSGV